MRFYAKLVLMVCLFAAGAFACQAGAGAGAWFTVRCAWYDAFGTAELHLQLVEEAHRERVATGIVDLTLHEGRRHPTPRGRR